MAREKVSNEIIAQVLTQSASNLEKALEKHCKSIEEVTKTKVQVDTTEMQKEKKEIDVNISDFKQFLNNYAVNLHKTEKPLKRAEKIAFYTLISSVAFAIGVALIIYFKVSADNEQKLKAKFVDEVLFESENKSNFIKLYDKWKIKEEKAIKK